MANKHIERLNNKLELTRNAFKAKLAIKAVLHGDEDLMSDLEYTMLLAQDDDMRKATQIIAEGILNPTPLTSLKTERTNLYLDIGMGVSAFLDEYRSFDRGIVDNMALIESKAMNLDLGLDKDISPHMRKQFLEMAGLGDAEIDTFITYEDFAEYESQSLVAIREYHMERLGYTNEDDMDEESKLMLDNLVDDSVAVGLGEMSQQVDVVSDLEMYGNPRRYEELFGMDAKTMHDTFDPESKVEILDHMYPEYTNGYVMSEHDPMFVAMREFQGVMHANTEMNEKLIQMLEKQIAQVSNVNLSIDDLEDLEHEVPVISDEELAALGIVEPEYEQ